MRWLGERSRRIAGVALCGLALGSAACDPFLYTNTDCSEWPYTPTCLTQ